MQQTKPIMRKTPLAALALLALVLAMSLCAASSAHAAQLEAGAIAPSALAADAGLAGQAASSKSAAPAIQYRVKAAKASWSGAKAGGKTASIGKSALSQFKLKLAGAEPPGAVKYRAYVSGKGWRPWKAGNKPAGAKTGALETVQVKLAGKLARTYSVCYRVRVSERGWMGWAADGEKAGAARLPGKRITGIQVKLVAKGAGAPVSKAPAYVSDRSKLVKRAVTVVDRPAGYAKVPVVKEREACPYYVMFGNCYGITFKDDPNTLYLDYDITGEEPITLIDPSVDKKFYKFELKDGTARVLKGPKKRCGVDRALDYRKIKTLTLPASFVEEMQGNTSWDTFLHVAALYKHDVNELAESIAKSDHVTYTKQEIAAQLKPVLAALKKANPNSTSTQRFAYYKNAYFQGFKKVWCEAETHKEKKTVRVYL